MDSLIDISKLETLVKSLNDSLDTAGTRLELATAAVVIGLLIEYEENAREVFRSLLEGARNRNLVSFRSLGNHIKRAVLGGIFITVGVGAELWYEHRTSVIDGRLQSANSQIVAFLYGKARDAELSTQQLKTQEQYSKERSDTLEARLERERQKTALFQKEATEAQRALVADLSAQKKFSAESASQLEGEKKTRLALAVSLLPRTLCDQSGTMGKLLRLPVTKAVFEFPDEREPRDIAEEIAAMFNRTALVSRRVAMDELISDGITISTGYARAVPSVTLTPQAMQLYFANANARAQATKSVASLLVASLSGCGIEATEGSSAFDIPSDAVLIAIGKKPNRALEATLRDLAQPGPSPLNGNSGPRMSGNRMTIPYESTPNKKP